MRPSLPSMNGGWQSLSLESTVNIRVTLCCTFCRFGQIFKATCPPLRCHTGYFHCPKTLCVLPLHPPPPKASNHPCFTVPPPNFAFLGCHRAGISSHGCLSLGPTWLGALALLGPPLTLFLKPQTHFPQQLVPMAMIPDMQKPGCFLLKTFRYRETQTAKKMAPKGPSYSRSLSQRLRETVSRLWMLVGWYCNS